MFDSFRQQFAQVTNPPIDPLREQIVMSLETSLGGETNPFEEAPSHVARLITNSPILSEGKFLRLLGFPDQSFAHQRIDLNYPQEVALAEALADICDKAVDAVRDKRPTLVLSDRAIAPDKLPVHALLATGAVQQRLISEGLRCDANIVVETGTTRDPHHYATLIGYGATAVYPYLAYEVLHDIQQCDDGSRCDSAKAGGNYRRGINKGLYKIMSKMGISTINSYRGAQLFEIVGLHEEVVSACFANTPSRIQGLELCGPRPGPAPPGDARPGTCASR